MTPKLRRVLVIVAVIAPLDQATKWWIETNVPPWQPIVVIEGFFQLTHARNPGAALGLFQYLPIWVFIGLAVLALVLISSFYRQLEPDDRFASSALGLIFGGAIGNLVDRVLRHEVVDWIQFDLGLFVFPDFNVADSAIVIGVGLLLLEIVASETEESIEREAGPPDDPVEGSG